MTPEFAPDDRIDTRSFELLEKAFGIDYDHLVFVSNESYIEHFSLEGKSTLGKHAYIRISEIPEDDKTLYWKEAQEFKGDEYRARVLYPPLTESEKRRISVRNRIKAIRQVELAYGIRMKQFKNVDLYPNLTVYEVAEHIDKIIFSRLQDLGKNKNPE